MTAPDLEIDLGEMQLALGGKLAQTRLRYVTLGKLNGRGDNAIIILHGYTSSHRFVLQDDPNNAEGSWGPLIGPGRAIDTSKFFVIAPNALGSSYGSTGPGCINPDTGRHFGPDFPALTFEDQVNAQSKLLQHLGVTHLHAVIGLSMGGFGAFQWAVQHPDFARKVIPVLTAPWGTLNQAASQKSVNDVLLANPYWQQGWYYDHLDQLQDTLSLIRINTLERYGVPKWLANQFEGEAQAHQVLQQMAVSWAKRFDANALLTLRNAINRFDVRDKLSQTTAQFLYVLCNTDSLFPPTIAQETLSRLPVRENSPQYVEINSAYGHFASSLDWQLWATDLANFLNH